MTTDTQQPTQQVGGVGHVYGDTPPAVMNVIQEIERQHRTKVDLVVQADRCTAQLAPIPTTDGNFRYEMHFTVPIPGADWLNNASYTMQLNEYAHAQLASLLGIGKTYYDRMRDAGTDIETISLLVKNVNHWLERHGKRFMVRTLDNHIRAFMSASYKPRDNFDLLNALLQPIMESGATITRLDLTDRRFYLRAVHNEWRERIERQRLSLSTRNELYMSWLANITGNGLGDMAPFLESQRPSPLNLVDDSPDGGFGLPRHEADEWIVPGLIAENSEIGQGMTTIAPFALNLVCMNGMKLETKIAVRHVGSAASVLDGFLSEETIAKENELVWAQTRDIATAVFDLESFRKMIQMASDAANQVIEQPVEVVDRTIGQFNIDPSLRQTLLNQLIAGGDPTKWGLINAVTAVAQQREDFDERMDLERIGGRMVEEHQLIRVR